MLDLMIREFSTKCHELAKSKGWWDRPPEKGTYIALIQSELSEMLEALRAPELNEVCDKCNGHGVTELTYYARTIRRELSGQTSIGPVEEKLLAHNIARKLLGMKQINAQQQLQFDEFYDEDCAKCGGSGIPPGGSREAEEAADVAIRLFDYVNYFKIDLIRALIEKYNYNEGRPHRHGDKAF